MRIRKWMRTLPIVVVILVTCQIYLLSLESPFTVTWTSGSRSNDLRIFFHETTGASILNVRQSCALESTARHNPSRPVELYLHTVQDLDVSHPFYSSVIAKLDNVNVIVVDTAEYFAGTLLDTWYLKGEWKYSHYKTVHISDYVRLLTLKRGGGMYMDLDYLTLKPFDDELQNFFVKENSPYSLTTNSVFHLESGHWLIDEWLHHQANHTYQPDKYFVQGPSVVTSVLNSVCNESANVASRCKDVNILDSSTFFPIPNVKAEILFQFPSNDTYNLLINSFAVHMWNSETRNIPLDLVSEQLFSVLARNNCPLTVAVVTAWV